MHIALRAHRRVSLYQRAEALEALASLLRGGMTVTESLREWHQNVAPELAGSLRKVGRLVALGAPSDVAVRPAEEPLGDDLQSLAAALDLHAVIGADPIPMLERAAEIIRQRADSQASGRAATAGAKLSGLMVGGLPLVSLPLLPMSQGPVFDAAGLAVLFFGLALAAAGMGWMTKLAPKARPGDEPVALFADHVAAGLRSGVSLDVALDAAARHSHGPLGTTLIAARRRTRLGQPWPEALGQVDPDAFTTLAATLTRAQRLGSPPGPALEAFARMRRAQAEQALELEIRRAPVLMVLPLVLCVLPSFGLLAIVPFLRGLAFS